MDAVDTHYLGYLFNRSEETGIPVHAFAMGGLPLGHEDASSH